MKARLLWSPQAREDLLAIYVAIGLRSPERAERVYSTIEAAAELLITHPRLGLRRPEIRYSTRILIEGHHLVLYETHPDTDEGPVAEVEIVRIVDGRRNLERLF